VNVSATLRAVFGLGDVERGTDHWWGQRLSAIALALLGLWFVVALATLSSFAHTDVAAFIAMPLNSVLLSLFCVTLAYHSYLGVQVVIEDYVHAAGLNKASLIISRIAHLVVASVAVYAILGIGSGA
jgi:succinate dehydrogenase / fumarate reductase membrane anchor subunit